MQQQPDFLERLEVLKAADDLVLAVYKYTKLFPKEELFGLINQMRRAAISVPANITEGYSRNSAKDKLHFYYISRGSLTELRYYVRLAAKLGFLNQQDSNGLNVLLDKTARLLTGLIGFTASPNRQSPVASRSSGLSAGQTLIETIVAIFVLTAGLIAGLTLATYAFTSSADIADRVAATGLAREGVEAVRRMRDANWMNDTLLTGGVCGAGQHCYRDWLTERYNINPGASRNYRLRFRPQNNSPCTSPSSKWCLDTGTDYRLYNMIFTTGGFDHSPVGASATNFFRKVTIVRENASAPYSATSPRMLVRSTVWWHGKGCNNSLTNLTNPNQTRCRVITEEFLTNWRNY